MYDALDIAEYVLHYCENQLNNAITNLQLQKFLYYIQGRYIAINGIPLFDNRIEAWRYGPVIPDVYYWYNDHIAEPITGIEFTNDINLEEDEINIINQVINEKIILDPWKLVEDTHHEKPWIDNYSEYMNFEIPIEELEDYFMRE